MSITDEEKRRIEQIIIRWSQKAKSHRKTRDDLARQIDNWLFGLQVGLTSLGLHDLATLAEAAQQFDAKE